MVGQCKLNSHALLRWANFASQINYKQYCLSYFCQYSEYVHIPALKTRAAIHEYNIISWNSCRVHCVINVNSPKESRVKSIVKYLLFYEEITSVHIKDSVCLGFCFEIIQKCERFIKL